MNSTSLAKEDFQVIENYVKDNLANWLIDTSIGRPPVVYEIELRERIIRVDEELKHQRELIKQMLHQMDKRFEQVDKRFEQIDKRFEEINRRLDLFMRWSFGLTITAAGIVIAAIKFL